MERNDVCIAQSRDMRNMYKSWVLLLSYHGLGRMIILRLHEKCKDKKLILIIKANQMHCFSSLFLVKNSTCFRHIYCPSSGVSTLYTQQ